MLDNILLFFGINMIEAILFILFVLKFKIKNVDKFTLVFAIFGVTCINYLSSMFLIRIPFMSQISIVLFSSMLVAYLFDMNYMYVLRRFIYATLFIFIITEGMCASIYLKLFDINLMKTEIVPKFLLFVPIRIVELFVAYNTKGEEVYEDLVGHSKEENQGRKEKIID